MERSAREGFWEGFGDSLNQQQSGLSRAQRWAAGVSKLAFAK